MLIFLRAFLRLQKTAEMDKIRKEWQPVLENNCMLETMLKQLPNNKSVIVY